jgi:hydrogenase maturation protease
VRVVALGSPHGDDRAGWEVAERLRQQRPPGVEVAIVTEPLRLVEQLGGCACLVVVDACRSGGVPGTVVRLCWPDDRLAGGARASTHGFGVADALALANALGRLPPRVVLIGIDVGDCEPGAELSAAVQAALPELHRQVLDAIGTQGGQS